MYSSAANTYRLVYDIGDAWAAWYFPAVGFLFLWVGILMFRARHSASSWGFVLRRPWSRGLFSLWWIAFMSLWTGLASYGIFGDHWQGQRILRAGTSGVVVGRVERFQSGKEDRFSVSGIDFRYSFSGVTPGFRSPFSPLRDGLEVRIHYGDVRGRRAILRLEVKE